MTNEWGFFNTSLTGVSLPVRLAQDPDGNLLVFARLAPRTRPESATNVKTPRQNSTTNPLRWRDYPTGASVTLAHFAFTALVAQQ